MCPFAACNDLRRAPFDKLRARFAASPANPSGSCPTRGNSGLICVAIKIVNFSANPSDGSARIPFGSEMNALIKAGLRRVAFAAGVGFPLLFASGAFAQQVEAERVIVTGEPVIVTGSLIPTTEEVGSNPVSILNGDLINKSGQGTTTEQLLKSLSIASANSIPVQNNATAVGGPPGAASVSLRGFDPGATLVLIDGRRGRPLSGDSPLWRRFF